MTQATIAVNEAILLRGTSGSAVATLQIEAALTEDPRFEVERKRPGWARGKSSLRNAFRDAKWDLWGAAAASGGAEVLISPCNIGVAKRGQRHLLVVHDVMLWERPELFDSRYGAYARVLIPYSLKRADLVLTTSEHAAASLREMAPGSDIRVQPWAGSLGRSEPATNRTATFPVGRPTVLCVGAALHHKNQTCAVAAVERLRRLSGSDIRLRLVGPTGAAEHALMTAVRRADPAGSWITREMGLSDAQLDLAYRDAWVLMQPSLNEGYGLPLVEAAQRGLPVVHSGAGGMGEVLKEASIDSTEPDAFSEALGRLLTEGSWKHRSEYVLAQAEQHYSWESVARGIRSHVGDLLATSYRGKARPLLDRSANSS